MTIIDIAAQKRELRNRMRGLRREFLATAAGQAAAEQIADKALTLPCFARAKNVLAYASQEDELPLYDFLRVAQTVGKKIFLPGRGETAGEMCAVRWQELGAPGSALSRRSVWHEPSEREVLPPDAIDLIIVPGVAFTPHGSRLGMGGGYYDRYLPRAASAYRLALAAECQIVSELPVEAHDAKVHGILTECRFIEILA